MTRSLVGAHHDKTGTGRGIADNWTGVIMLTQLKRHTSTTAAPGADSFIPGTWWLSPRKKVACMGRKDTCVTLSESEALPRYMINLDAVGIDTLHIDPRSDTSLMCPVIATADALDVDIEVVSISETTGDWEPVFQGRR